MSFDWNHKNIVILILVCTVTPSISAPSTTFPLQKKKASPCTFPRWVSVKQVLSVRVHITRNVSLLQARVPAADKRTCIRCKIMMGLS